MRKQLLPPPSLNNLIQTAKTIINDFQPKKFTFLNSKGKWEDNPKSLKERISNEILYQFWSLDEEKQMAFIQNIFFPFSQGKYWTITKKIKLALQEKSKLAFPSLKEKEINTFITQSYSEAHYSKKDYPFLIILEVLSFVLHYEAIGVNSESFVPRWDSFRKSQNQEYKNLFISLNNFLNEILSEEEKKSFFPSIIAEIKEGAPQVLEQILKIAAEEDRLMKTIHHLLMKAKDTRSQDEIYSLICEKIQPAMGIVTHTSPALLLPCLYLLMDEEIDISSGIQYNASVILSILQDPRSTETLLKALNSFPLQYTKIRENLIYTLGNLKEKKAAKAIAQVLEEPDYIEISPRRNQKRKIFPIVEQKEEAIWALGKIGLKSLPHLSILVKYADHPRSKIKTYLAWTLGEIGKAQKEKFRGVSVDIAITLLNLLKTNNKQVFEEAVSALKKIDMPEFTHSLYLYNIGAVSILGLKPAQKGLYELSETIHYLLNNKKKVIIAVTGDSGTGKTYFCQSIIKGFGNLKPEEILYLMRDRRKDQKIFNRILGLKWLKKYIDPIYYQDNPLSEEEDDPQEFIKKFLDGNSQKKLIILDGCRDERYFQRVIDLFYFQGKLDVVVNFRSAFSTRRLNLESREIALESVKTHLSFTEEPSLEDTHFYQEGMAILYDLDNSISSRLSSQEIQELFGKRKIDSWGELIRIGEFNQKSESLKMKTGKLHLREKSFSLKSEEWPKSRAKFFSAEEIIFKPQLNKNLSSQPNLLQTIDVEDLKPKKIRFYAQDQIAGIGDKGSVFVLTLLDNRIFYTFTGDNRDLTLLGRDIFLVDNKGEMTNISFERNEKVKFRYSVSPITAIASFPREKIITGHKDGTIRIWDFLNQYLLILEGHHQPISSLAVDYYGRIYSGSVDHTLKRWDIEKRRSTIVENLTEPVTLIKIFPQQRILALTEADDSPGTEKEIAGSKIRILDFNEGISQVIHSPFENKFNSINAYFDGRIMATLSSSKKETAQRRGGLIIISTSKNLSYYKLLAGHRSQTKDCLVMGPRIITCGVETSENHTLCLWGTEFYVRMESGKFLLRE